MKHEHVAEKVTHLKEQIAKVIVGQGAVIEEVLQAILAGGHCLIGHGVGHGHESIGVPPGLPLEQAIESANRPGLRAIETHPVDRMDYCRHPGPMCRQATDDAGFAAVGMGHVAPVLSEDPPQVTQAPEIVVRMNVPP